MAGIARPLLLISAVLALFPLYQTFMKTGKSRLVSLIRALLIIILAVAASGPYILGKEPVSDDAQIVVLKDSSKSAQLMNKIDPDFEDIETRESLIASGNSSDIRNGILRNLEPRTNYLLISDLQSEENLDGVAERANQLNSTINALKTEMEEDYSVKIEGPESTVPGAENRYVVRVKSTNTGDNPPKPTVTMNGNSVELAEQSDNVWSFNWEFSSQGSHRIRASIDTSDEFSNNNRYYKSVRVTEKPEVLVVGESGPLEGQLKEFYEIERRSNLPESLEEYYAVILKKEASGDLKSYTSKGNGVVFTGDLKRDTIDVLPVRTIPEGEQEDGAKIVIAIDLSFSTGGCPESDKGFCVEYGGEGGIKQSQRVAYSLVDALPFNNKVGAVAYNREAYRIARPRPLAYNRKSLKNRISRLSPEGPSFHNNGLRGAKELLNGTGNIILLSDGKIGALGQNNNVGIETKQIARDLDVRLITVGVGDQKDTEFLRELSRLGGGQYMDAESSGNLKFVFGAGGAEGQTEGLVAVDNYHPITKGLDLDSQVVFFDSVEPRRGSDLLATTTSGKPFLTTWNYGLGRVAAFSAGGKDLQKVLSRDPKVVTRTVSWAVGSPERKREKWIRADSGRRNEEVEIQASYSISGLKREGKDLYSTDARPKGLGFHQFQDYIYSYNYHPEIENIGYGDLEELVQSTGGKVYSRSEFQDIVEDTKQFSENQVKTRKSVAKYFLIAALVVFLIEVGYRKRKGMK